MPATLVHFGVQGLATRAIARAADPRFVFAGCLVPDVPWIVLRLLRSVPHPFDPYELQLYALVQSSLLFCLVLAGALALLAREGRLVFAIVAGNSLLHLLLDACEDKWGNGVLLLAPLSWDLTHFDLVDPESAGMAALAVVGLVVTLLAFRSPVVRQAPFAPLGAPRVLTALALGAVYAVAPLLLTNGPHESDARYLATQGDVTLRAGRTVELDRVRYRALDGGGRVQLYGGDEVGARGALPPASGLVSIRGVFTDSRTLEIREFRTHETWVRDAPTYVALVLFLALWGRGLGARRATLVAGLVVCLGCAGPDRPAIENVVLVSIDTCRADRLGSYGFPRATTPNLDRLAATGVRFERALSPVPLTLPAHASMMTGTTPLRHAVHDNATRPLAAASVTLAEILAARGFATGAIVSAFVLDSRFGLDQGFLTYDDTFEEPITSNAIPERGAGETTRRAIAWLGENAARPFFLFLHYYDPHMLYAPPEPYASRFADDPYAGEIAHVDARVGEVVAELARLGVLDRTLVVVTADHGEMLGEHGEETHGWFVYEAAIRVPLILHGPGLAPRVVRDSVGLVDLLPTICGLLGLPAPAAAEGTDLAPLLRGAPAAAERELYAESLEPTKYAANPLLALVAGRFKLIETTRPELYDVAADPGEARDLTADEPERAAAMRRRIVERVREAALETAPAGLDRETRERIEALGYIAGGAGADLLVENGRDDPKDLVAFRRTHLTVPPLLVRGDLAEARRRTEALLAERPGFVEGHLVLARIARDERRFDQAIAHYERALELRPDQPGVLADLGVALAAEGRVGEAIARYERALELDPDHVEALNNLGNALLRSGRSEQALAHYLRALEVRPDSVEAQLNAGLALLRLGRRAEALERLRAAERLGSRDPATLETLAAALAAAAD